MWNLDKVFHKYVSNTLRHVIFYSQHNNINLQTYFVDRKLIITAAA